MTMRQVVGLLKVINKSESVQFYYSALSYKAWSDGKIPSLNEFLNAGLNKDSQVSTSDFDDETDKLLERHARKVLEQRKLEFNGK